MCTRREPATAVDIMLRKIYDQMEVRRPNPQTASRDIEWDTGARIHSMQH